MMRYRSLRNLSAFGRGTNTKKSCSSLHHRPVWSAPVPSLSRKRATQAGLAQLRTLFRGRECNLDRIFDRVRLAWRHELINVPLGRWTSRIPSDGDLTSANPNTYDYYTMMDVVAKNSASFRYWQPKTLFAIISDPRRNCGQSFPGFGPRRAFADTEQSS